MIRPSLRIIRFEPDLERRYRDEQRARLLPLVRIGPLAGALLALAFGLRDHQLVPLYVDGMLVIHAALAGLLLAVSAATFTRAGTAAQDVLVVLGLLAGVAGIALIGAAELGHFEHLPPALLLALFFGSALTADLRAQVVLGLGYVAVPNAMMQLAGTPPSGIATVNWWIVSGALSSLLLAYLMDATNRRAFLLEVACEEAHRRSDELLLSILPKSIISRLEGDDGRVADLVEDAGVLFADIVGFIALARRLSPAQLVETLDRVFTDLDAVAAQHGVEKIKTIGDAYMVAVGVADAARRDVSALAEFALEARDTVWHVAAEHDDPIQLRIGLCAGPVISGVIGRRRPHFDLWGDTVNTASRLESGSRPGEIQVDERTYRRLRHAFDFELRGVVDLKGLGPVATYLLKGRTATTTASTAPPLDVGASSASPQPRFMSPTASPGTLRSAKRSGDDRRSPVVEGRSGVMKQPSVRAVTRGLAVASIVGLLSTLVGAVALTPLASAAAPPVQGTVWVADEDGNGLTVIDAATNQVVTRLVGIEGPHNVQVAPDGRSVWVVSGHESLALMIDAETYSLRGTVPTGKNPAHIVVTPNGRTAYVTNGDDNTVTAVDVATMQVIATIPVGEYPHGLRPSPDSQWVYVANAKGTTLSVIETATSRTFADVEVGRAPVQVAFSPDGASVYFSLNAENAVGKVDVATRTLVGKVPVGVGPVQVFATPDDRYVLAANQGTRNSPSTTVSIIDTATFAVVGTVETGKGAHGVAIEPSGAYAYITNIYGDDLAVLDIAERKIVATVPTGASPNGVSFSPLAPAPAPSAEIRLVVPEHDDEPDHDDMPGMQH